MAIKAWDGSGFNGKQIRVMHENGTVDIRPHSMNQHSISISSRFIDFVRPVTARSFWETDLLLLTRAGVRDSHDLPNGAPIYGCGPRFGEARACRDHPSLAVACVEHVDCHGGAEHFGTRRWHRELERLIAAARRRQPSAGFETEPEQRRAILDDSANSKSQIERGLPGRTVRHFSYAWFYGSILAATLSADAGYVSNAWGSVLSHSVTYKHLPRPFAGLSPACRWWRLPGKGRKPLGEVIRGIGAGCLIPFINAASSGK